VALTSGFAHALLACSLFFVVAAVIGARSTANRGQHRSSTEPVAVPDAA
jgi:hypothetical protein